MQREYAIAWDPACGPPVGAFELGVDGLPPHRQRAGQRRRAAGGERGSLTRARHACRCLDVFERVLCLLSFGPWGVCHAGGGVFVLLVDGRVGRLVLGRCDCEAVCGLYARRPDTRLTGAVIPL